jgi:hypothetical protein
VVTASQKLLLTLADTRFEWWQSIGPVQHAVLSNIIEVGVFVVFYLLHQRFVLVLLFGKLVEFRLLNIALTLEESFRELVIFTFNTLVFSLANCKIETLWTLRSATLAMHNTSKV